MRRKKMAGKSQKWMTPGWQRQGEGGWHRVGASNVWPRCRQSFICSKATKHRSGRWQGDTPLACVNPGWLPLLIPPPSGTKFPKEHSLPFRGPHTLHERTPKTQNVQRAQSDVSPCAVESKREDSRGPYPANPVKRWERRWRRTRIEREKICSSYSLGCVYDCLFRLACRFIAHEVRHLFHHSVRGSCGAIRHAESTGERGMKDIEKPTWEMQ